MSRLTYWKMGAAAVALAALVLTGVWLVRSVQQTEVGVDIEDGINLTGEQIESIKAIGQWEFLTVTDEVMVDTVRHGFFSDDQLARIYYGTLRIGINMQQVQPHWIEVRGDSVEVTLPRVRLLDNDFIDETLTKSFYESGRWKPADREALYQRARRTMLRRGLTQQNLETARQNGAEQFRQLMRSMGYRHVAIRWEQ